MKLILAAAGFERADFRGIPLQGIAEGVDREERCDTE